MTSRPLANEAGAIATWRVESSVPVLPNHVSMSDQPLEGMDFKCIDVV